MKGRILAVLMTTLLLCATAAPMASASAVKPNVTGPPLGYYITVAHECAASKSLRTGPSKNMCINAVKIDDEGMHLSKALGRCLIAAGVTSGGIIIGGIIGGAEALAIAGSVIGGSASSCVGVVVER